MFLGECSDPDLALPICVTEAEKVEQATLTNKSVNTLISDINILIASLEEDFQRSLFEKELKKAKTKAQYIQLYEAIVDYIDIAQMTTMDIEASDD